MVKRSESQEISPGLWSGVRRTERRCDKDLRGASSLMKSANAQAVCSTKGMNGGYEATTAFLLHAWLCSLVVLDQKQPARALVGN